MRKIYLMLATFMLLCVCAMSQTPMDKTVKPVFGKPGVKKTIAELQAHTAGNNFKKKALDSSAIKPIRSFYKRYNNGLIRSDRQARLGPPFVIDTKTNANKAVQIPMAAVIPTGSTQQIWSNFLGIDFYENEIGWPPDPSGDVSNDQVVVCTNNGLKIVDKKGVTDPPLVSPDGYSREMPPGIFITLEDFFSAVIPDGSGISDPHIRYDRLSKRWFVVAIEVNPSFENNAIFLAVGDGNKISGTSSFTFYSFNSSLFPYDPGAPFAPFLDYPTLGVDNNAIVIGGNQFGWDSLTNVGYVIDKNKLLHDYLVIYPFELGVGNNITGDVSGMYTPQGVHNDDGTANKSFFAGITYFQDALVVAKIWYDHKHIPWLSAEYTLPVQQFTFGRDNSSPGGLAAIDQLDTRLFAASIHKNKITGKSNLWTAHAIGVNQEGNIITGSDSEFVDKGRTGSRWYEISNIYTTPTMNQWGTVIDADEPSGRRAKQYFNPSIAASGQGHAVLGGTVDAFNEYLNVFIAGRYNGEPKGTMHSPVKATNTTAIYSPYVNFFGTHFYIGRWGDFSQTVVDPWDDQTIWAFQEYADVDDSYGVRAVQVKAPPPATLPLELGALSNEKDTTILLQGTSIENSGFFDPGEDKWGPGFNRLSVKSTGSIIASNIKFISPTELKFKLNTKNQPAGNYFLIITNPDGQVAATGYTIGENAPVTAFKESSNSGLMNANIVKKYIVTSGIYPNPANNQVKLQVNAAKDFAGKVVLMNTGGKVVSQNSYNFSKGAGEALLSLSNLSSGTYIAAVYNEYNTLIAVHPVVKQ